MITNKEAIAYFKRHLDLYCVDGISRESEEMAIKALEQQKTGHWIKIQSGDKMFPEIIVCSKCNNENSHLDFNEYAEPIGKVFIKSRYCPNCGAKMQEVEE